MGRDVKRIHTFEADGQRYEIRWEMINDNIIRQEVYKSPKHELVLAIELPGRKEFIENEGFCSGQAKKIEKIFRGEGLTLKDITG
ncbi:MAG: hypothetical protein ABR913_05920 [Sedimentisphaerales bacterium]|jgi:hypothetical protein